jgi:hypothetical protein
MDESLFDGAAVARFDQAIAEAADWARALVELRAKLCAGGFTPREAYRLSRLWFGEHLCHQLTEAAFGESYFD